VRPPSAVTPSTARVHELPPTSAVTRIDQYDLIYRLGTGGMGNVYLARRRNQSGLQRLFAVKAMHPLLSADHDFANMFLDEAHIASRLHHINVVGIVDLGRYAGRLYLVMDYVEGPTLAQLLGTSAERPPSLICSILIDMLHGLQAAHGLTNESGERLDLVHRDVSPSNILIGTDGVARLTDFGIAKARLRRTSTSPGVRKGKLCYSAPEQITRPGEEDSRVDVFAAGIVLWNSLTGTRLFDGDNEAAVILSVVNKPIPPPSTVGRRPPRCLDEVCLRALERDPARRYQTAAHMADDLRRVTRENNLVAGPEQVAEWVAVLFGEELERRRAAVRAIASGAADEPGAAQFARGTGPQAPELEPEYAELSVSWHGETPPGQRRHRAWPIPVIAIAAAVSAVVIALSIYPPGSKEPASAAPVAPMLVPEAEASVPEPATTPAEPAPAVKPLSVNSPPPTPAARAPVAAPAAPAEKAMTVEKARAEPPTVPRARRHRPTRVVPRRAAPRAAAVEAPQPKAAPAPEPEPPTDSIESNPYLRTGSR
jgi:serine/threonine-protein kinase